MLEHTFNREYLRSSWVEIHNRLYATGTKVKPDFDEFERILACYKVNGRHYHGIKHLVHGLDMIQKLFRDKRMSAPPMRDGALLMLAFFYHDIVYDVRSNTNEADSAEQASQYLSSLGVCEDEVLRVHNLIMGTANHQACESTDPLWPIMNDADLAILSAREDIYKKYAKKVWNEYRVIAKRLDFVKGRMTFLMDFNSKPIFRTPVMILKENAAKANLLREWVSLSTEAA